MLKLDKRLEAILQCIPKGCRLIDLGCDHGKISVSALVNNIANIVIATDISAPSLDKTRKLGLKYDVNSRLELRLGDGLDIIDDNEADTLLIAGMGAREIISILDRSKLRFSTYIFTPHQETVKLRLYLVNNGYNIISDNKVKSAEKFYDIIVCVKGLGKANYKELMLGKSDDTNEDYREFILYEKHRLEWLTSIKPQNTPEYEEIIRYQGLINEVIDDKG